MAIKSATLLFVLLTGLLSACSTPLTATTDFDSSFDFSPVRNVAIQPFNRSVDNNVILSDMQVERINQALADELVGRGYNTVENNADADLLLTWLLVTEERTDVRSYNSSSRYNCWHCGGGADVRVVQFTQGTFIVDMIDPARGQSVWRAIIQSRMQEQSDPDSAAEKRRTAAAAVFADFPPN